MTIHMCVYSYIYIYMYTVSSLALQAWGRLRPGEAGEAQVLIEVVVVVVVVVVVEVVVVVVVMIILMVIVLTIIVVGPSSASTCRATAATSCGASRRGCSGRAHRRLRTGSTSRDTEFPLRALRAQKWYVYGSGTFGAA